jgi:hypothetical protein
MARPPKLLRGPTLRRVSVLACCSAALPAWGVADAVADVTTAYDQTFMWTGSQQVSVFAEGVRNVDVTAIGGWGASKSGVAGGRPAQVQGTIAVDGLGLLYVLVAGSGSAGNGAGGFNGGGGNSSSQGAAVGGGGGGASDVRTQSPFSSESLTSRRLVAAGGGGAGARADGGTGATDGGAGGNAGLAGARAPSAGAGNTIGSGGYGGALGTASAGGAGADPGFPYSPSGATGSAGLPGQRGLGGAGGAGPFNTPAGWGGGGAGGLFGGGGGGGGGTMTGGDTPRATGGGGGGGGASLVPAGGSAQVVAAASGSPSIRVRYTVPGTDVSGPTGAIAQPQATFALSATEAGATFECRLDSAAESDWVPCAATFTVTVLGEGAHELEVRAVNSMGNVDGSPARAGFAVDTIAPTTTIATGPAGVTSDAQPAFTFTADEPDSAFECRIDGAAFGPCSGGGEHRPATPLADGDHDFAVRAIDTAGNRGPEVTRAFTVRVAVPGGGAPVVDAPGRDVVAPVLSDLSVDPRSARRARWSAKRRLRVRFSVSERATVEANVTGKVPGRRVGTLCKPTAKHVKRGRRCRAVRRVASRSATVEPGRHTLSLALGKRPPTARYSVTLAARDAAGNGARTLAARLRIRR